MWIPCQKRLILKRNVFIKKNGRYSIYNIIGLYVVFNTIIIYFTPCIEFYPHLMAETQFACVKCVTAME